MRVVDIIGRTPRIEYAGRSAALAGLREPQLVQALGSALSNVELQLRNATCRLVQEPTPHYEIALAAGRMPSRTDLEIMLRSLDFRLKELSIAYREERAAGRLGEVRVRLTHPDAFLREWERAVRGGQRPPRVKDRVFQPDPQVWQRLLADPVPAQVEVAR